MEPVKIQVIMSRAQFDDLTMSDAHRESILASGKVQFV